MGTDDQRAAVGFSVTLSGQLLAAALALLAIEGAYVAYALAERLTTSLFLPAAAAAAIAFAISAFIAGKAVTKDRNAGFEGRWSLVEAKGLYNAQAAALLLGLLAFAVALGSSGSRVESKPASSQAEQGKFTDIRAVVDSLTAAQHIMSQEIGELRALIDRQRSESDTGR